MTTKPPMRRANLMVVIIIAAIIIGAGIAASTYLREEKTTVTVVDSQIYSNVTDGIQLSAIIQPSEQVYGQNYTIVASVTDVLSTSFQLNASALDNPVHGPCEQDFATGVDVYSGRYYSSNISQVKPLLLYNPSLSYTCSEAMPQLYSFEPAKGVSETSILSGYWTGSGQSYSFNGFPPGLYTVVVFDAWNQTAIGYIQADYPSNS